MSNVVRAEDSYLLIGLGHPPRVVWPSDERRWTCFAAIWWDIGLVATPAQAILAAASVAHDAVDEWRAEFPYLLHDVPCCFRITRHTRSRTFWPHAGRSYRNLVDRRDLRAHLRAWDRKEWPSLPGHNDYRGNVRDTAWLDVSDVAHQLKRSWFGDTAPPSHPNCRSFARWDEAPTTPIDSIAVMRERLLLPSQPRAVPVSREVYERLAAHLQGHPPAKTPRQHTDRAARRRRKRGRR